MTALSHRWPHRLALRMAMPIVVVIGLVGVGLYFFVLRSVSNFADEQIRESLIDMASEVYDICDENFTAAMQSGQMNDPAAVTIRKAYTLGAIEEFLSRNDIGGRLQDGAGVERLRTAWDLDLSSVFVRHPDEGAVLTIDQQGKKLYFYHITFKPWGWHVDLVKDMAAYAPLIAKVKRIYLITGALLVGGLILILFFQERLFRRPLNRIIDAIQRGRAPDDEGIYEFSFLSRSIAAMMRSLEERNQWIEKLYHIAITHRGQAYFTNVAGALCQALDASVLIVAGGPPDNRFSKLAWAPGNAQAVEPGAFFHSWPLKKIADDQQAVVIAGAPHPHEHGLPAFFSAGASSYAGIPVISRENRVIGVVNVFRHSPTIDEWNLNLIKTVCQMVAVELEFSVKENDRIQLEVQLQKSQKMEAIGMLAGGVAHDLNNILSGIVSYPDLLLMDLAPDSELRQPILTIKQSGERAATIVQDLLTLARRGVAISEVVNLNTIITQQLESPEFEKMCVFHPEVSVMTHLESDLLNIKGSATHLAKSIMNLISNAAEAMPDGGEIRITSQNRYVDGPIRGDNQVIEGEYVTVTVSDTGVGISAQDKDRIFEPFYTKKIMGRSGTGLGMAVVWGTIVDSGHDHGARHGRSRYLSPGDRASSRAKGHHRQWVFRDRTRQIRPAPGRGAVYPKTLHLGKNR